MAESHHSCDCTPPVGTHARVHICLSRSAARVHICKCNCKYFTYMQLLRQRRTVVFVTVRTDTWCSRDHAARTAVLSPCARTGPSCRQALLSLPHRKLPAGDLEARLTQPAPLPAPCPGPECQPAFGHVALSAEARRVPKPELMIDITQPWPPRLKSFRCKRILVGLVAVRESELPADDGRRVPWPAGAGRKWPSCRGGRPRPPRCRPGRTAFQSSPPAAQHPPR